MENLPKDERPPEHIWEDPEGLDEWWARVEDRREDRYGGSPGSGSAAGSEQRPDMAENEIARQLKNG